MIAIKRFELCVVAGELLNMGPDFSYIFIASATLTFSLQNLNLLLFARSNFTTCVCFFTLAAVVAY